MNELYFDNNATTPLDGVVLEALQGALAENYGNPSSRHPLGEKALAAVDRARRSLVQLVGANSPREIVFTSGGTESIHTAAHIALAEKPNGSVLMSSVEHAAVQRPLEAWSGRGMSLERIGVDEAGRLALDEVLVALAKNTLGQTQSRPIHLVSLLLANNETGVLLPVDDLEAIANGARQAGALVHLDAVQVPGKLPLQDWVDHADLISLSAHKFHGPKGVGALYVRSGLPTPAAGFLTGGPQEEERRAGTLNVPGIVGLGVAADRALEHLADVPARVRLRELRDRLETGLLARIPGLRIHASGAERLPNTSNVGLTEADAKGIDGELLHLSLAAEGLCVSGGSACSAHTQKPSDVLLAMGIPEDEARASLRFSLSRMTRPEEVDRAVEITARTISGLMGFSPTADSNRS